MLTKKTLILFLGIVSLAFILGCLGGGLSLSPEQIRANTLTAIRDVNSYAFNLETFTVAELPDLPNPLNATLRVKAWGIVNMKRRSSKMEMQLLNPPDLPNFPTSEEEANLTLYLLNDTIYVKVQNTWMRQRVPNPDEVWERQNQALQQVELMRGAKITLEDEEKIGGRRAYVLLVEPDKLKALNYLIDQSYASNLKTLTPQQLGNLSKRIKEFKMKMWIDSEEFLPLRVKTHIKLESKASMMESEVKIEFHDYNAKHKITLPEEAYNQSVELIV